MGTGLEVTADLDCRLPAADHGANHRSVDSWVSRAVSDCYTDVREGLHNPYALAAGAAVAVGVVGLTRLGSLRAAEVVAESLVSELKTTAPEASARLAATSTLDAAAITPEALGRALTPNLYKTAGKVATGIETPPVNGTRFIFRENLPGLGAKSEAIHLDRALPKAGQLPGSWVGGDGAQYNFKAAPVQDQSWHAIYESEFPADEQHPYSFIESLAAKDAVPQVSLQLTERNGKTAAFSMISDYGEGAEGKQLLLPYVAVKREFQNIGVGTEHLQRVIAESKDLFPTARGMAVEIEDPNAAGLSAEAFAQRTKRVNWYVDRHGAELLDRKYLIPSSEEGAAPIPGRLLWVDFNRGGASESSLHRLISSIYKHGYGLEDNHPVVAEILGKYSH